jgi:tetratricopeptide (TPR) repeat protein
MTHELGHVFGATHTNAPDTVMSPIVRYQIPTDFDAENREIISLTRKMDFRKGLESLSPADVQRLLGSYLKLMQFDQRFDFYYSLGVFYLRLGQTDDTLKAWEKAAELDPDNPRIYYDLGVLYMKRGQQDLAIQKLNLASRKLSHPSLSDLKAEALTYLGSAYFQKGSIDSAYQAWSKASGLRQKDENLKANLALIQLMMGKYNEAIRMLEEVIQKNPKNAKALDNLGYAYAQKNDYPQAITYLAKALKLAPNQTIHGPGSP